MSWNYRVVKKEDRLAIFAVYYNDRGEITGIGTYPEPVVSEDLDYLKTQLNLMLEAAEKEIIEFDTIEGKVENITTAWF